MMVFSLPRWAHNELFSFVLLFLIVELIEEFQEKLPIIDWNIELQWHLSEKHFWQSLSHTNQQKTTTKTLFMSTSCSLDKIDTTCTYPINDYRTQAQLLWDKDFALIDVYQAKTWSNLNEHAYKV